MMYDSEQGEIRMLDQEGQDFLAGASSGPKSEAQKKFERRVILPIMVVGAAIVVLLVVLQL